MARPRGQFFTNQVRTYNTIRGIAGGYVCFAKTKTLANRIGVCERQLYRYLAALQKEGMIVTSTKKRYNHSENTFSSIRYMMVHPEKLPYGREDFITRESNGFVSKPINNYSSVSKYTPVVEIKASKIEPPKPIDDFKVNFNPISIAPIITNSKRISLNPTIDEILNISDHLSLIPEGMKFLSGFEKECWFAYINQIMIENMPGMKIKQTISRDEWEVNVKCIKERTQKELDRYGK